MSRQQAQQMKTDATNYTNKLLGQPMIMDIVIWIQQNFSKYYIAGEDTKCDDTSDILTVLLHIDHMRAKAKYIKTIQKWTKELKLTGRLIFCGNYIFVLLQGNNECIKVFNFLYNIWNFENY
jgi:hypothetical protein